MTRYLYLSYKNTLLFVLTIVLILGTLLTHEDIVPYFAQKYAGDYGLKYSKLEGTLLFGMEVQDLSYEDFLKAKTLKIEYDFLSLLRLSPVLTKVQSESLYIDLDKLPPSDSNESTALSISLSVKKLLLKNSKINYDTKSYGFDIDAAKILFKEKLSAKKIRLALRSSYAHGDFEGSLSANVLKGDAAIKISEATSQEYLDFLQAPPQTLKCTLQADINNIKLSTSLETLKFKEIQSLDFYDVKAHLNYSINEQILRGSFLYTLLHEEYVLDTQQKFHFTFDGNFDSNINAKILNTPFALPFTKLNAKVSGSSKKIDVQVDAGKVHYTLKSDDYEKFSMQGEAQDLELSFIKELPQLLQKDRITFKSKANVQLSPLSIDTKIKINSLYYKLDAKATYKTDAITANISLDPKKNSALFKDLPIEKFLPINAALIANTKQETLDIQANILDLFLRKKANKITGAGTLASNEFTLSTDLDAKKPLEVTLDTKISSYKNTLKEFALDSSSLEDISDARIVIKSKLVLSEPFVINASLYTPSVAYKADAKTRYILSNINANTSLSENRLTLHDYSLEYKTHHIYSNNTSHIALQDNAAIFLKEFWVFDTLLLSGVYKTKELSGKLSLKSKKFHYKDKDFDINIAMDLQASMDANTAKVKGKVTLLDGNISYMPVSDYTISDPDIIILQEVPKKKATDVFLDIKVDAKKDIVYTNKNARIFLQPDVKVLKTPNKEIHLNGKVLVTKGEVSFSDKKFFFDASEVYFDGSLPINPKLNLNLHYYTLEYIDISIYVTHTLEEPVFIFSSDPAMSQNDIMSYILFGESASSVFSSSGNASKTSLLLGSGMKELFNTNSTIKLDTLNILTNSDGSVGYELGSRISKDMRIVYKNDTVSSVMLQYNLSKSTRIDVDVREAGQGVSFIYMKDFE